MSLQRRLLLYLLICAPLVWAVGLFFSVQRTRHEVNELYDSELVRMSRQVQSTLRPDLLTSVPGGANMLPGLSEARGEADAKDFALAVWSARGGLVMSDREGVQLPRMDGTGGFVDQLLGGKRWRTYYLQSSSGEWLVAAGQRSKERDELVYSLTVNQIAPWLLLLPPLLLAMAWAVRRALAPLNQLTSELTGRDANGLQRIDVDHAPSELKPLVGAMNGLFERIEQTLERERRFTADAAHELRTPLAALRAQWDVLRRCATEAERNEAAAGFTASVDRLDRLVTQMLALSRLEATLQLQQGLPRTVKVQWPAVVEQAMSDCLPIADRRHIELACEWPSEPGDVMPVAGDENLITVLLRNLLDNASRYAPSGSLVTMRLLKDRLEVENDGEPLSAEQLASLGDRFRRAEGQSELGSGLGVSIVQRIADLHSLLVEYGARADGRGVKVVVRRG